MKFHLTLPVMEASKILVVLQAVALCQGKLYIHQASEPCSWAVASSEENQSLPIFTDQSLQTLAAQICKASGCGEVYELHKSSAESNSSCLSKCIYHNKELINCSQTSDINCSILSEVVCDSFYIIKSSKFCVWNVKSLRNKSAIVLPSESITSLSSEICQSLGCGEVFHHDSSTASPGETCLTGCIHNNSFLNCSSTIRSNCSVLSEIICGNHKVRLVEGGHHHCAGRVELWHAGQWGTVCDDEWDKQDADVICAQNGCGYAISVTGQEGRFSPGKGPILMDELNCTGTERSLWECPATRTANDCGHKEDAGVVCSEYKDLRLTGGLDRCSGRVEIHRNGLWGTVCDTCWDEQEASMACSMLGCGSLKQFKDFHPQFTHKNETLWYFKCEKKHNILWDCKVLSGQKLYACHESNAAGVICNNSLGLPLPTSPSPNNEPPQMKPTIPTDFLSPESLACILLSIALLIAIVVNIILCCCAKKRKVQKFQQQFANLQNISQVEDNTYRDSVHLVKHTDTENNHSQFNTQIMPPPMWTQSSIDSDSVNEPSECSQSGSFPLSTFRNSMRYMPDRQTSATNETSLQILTEEGPALQGFQHVSLLGPSAVSSVDSFDSSSTSSGEVYENTGQNAEDFVDYKKTEKDRSDLQSGRLNMESSDGADSPIYSPVTAEVDYYNSDNDDYDDVANFSQTLLT